MITLEDHRKQYEDQICKWESFLGIPKTEPQRTEIDFILNLRKDEIKNIDSIQLSEYSLMLCQYAFFLQKKSNECETFLKWANNIINKINGDSVYKLTNMIKEIEIRLSRVAYLARRIEMVAQALTNISRARYNERK